MTPFAAVARAARWPELAAELSSWLPAQRWFQGKARDLAGIAVVDVAILEGTDGDAVLLVLVSVDYADGPDERYQVPLAVGSDPGGIGEVAGIPVRDALRDGVAARKLAACATVPAVHRTMRGAAVRGEPVVKDMVLPEAARPLGVEQSNTSVVLGDTLLLKVFRRLESGINPDVELTRGLTEHGFAHVPPQLGALLLDDGRESSALSVLTVFRAGAREGWDLACAEAASARTGTLPALLDGHAEALGEVSGHMHLALRDAFGQRSAKASDLHAWADAMRRQADAVLAAVGQRAPDRARRLLAHREALGAAFDRVPRLADGGALVRIHGDLHLGQVLLDPGHGWQILDFEGEPARSLAKRREPHSTLRDVAGMLRSFDYAAAHGAEPGMPVEPAVARWRDGLRGAFLDGYLRTCGDAGLLPSSASDRVALCTAFELDKAVYEVGYELANRPAWVDIPAGGIERLLAGQTIQPSR